MAPIECGFQEFYSQSWIDKPFQSSLTQQASPMVVKMHVVDTGDLHFNLTHQTELNKCVKQRTVVGSLACVLSASIMLNVLGGFDPGHAVWGGVLVGAFEAVCVCDNILLGFVIGCLAMLL